MTDPKRPDANRPDHEPGPDCPNAPYTCLTCQPKAEQARAGSPPYTLLAVGPDGRVGAAWAVRAPTPAAALIQLGELATSSGLDGYAIDPAGWRAASLDQPGHGERGWAYRWTLSPQPGPPDPAALAASLGTPPAGWPLAARARWAAQYALTVQAPLMARPGLVFHGTPGRHPGTGDVAIEAGDGGFLARLANAGYARSPAGFGWGRGYPSTSSWALARSVLTAALGPRARCYTCGGSARTAMTGDGALRPAWPGDDPEEVGLCPDCDGDGIAVPPAVTQAYAEVLAASLPAGEWRLDRADVLLWLETQLVDEDMYRLARMVER